MGTELSRGSDLLELERRLEALRSHPADIVRHGWDKSNMSPHLNILPGGITVQKVTKSNHKEVALGKVPYTQGIHVFEFTWKPGSNKHVSIGIASEDITVHSESGDYLLGNDDQSIAWELASNNIIFNGCVIKQMAPNQESAAAALPTSLIMVLNMNEGTLSFRIEDTFDTAMKGLKHVSDAFHVAVCLDKHQDQVTVKYLGNSDVLREDTTLSLDQPLRFHDTCGKNIVLSANNTVATRSRPRNTFNHATVFSNRPLKDGEMFTVSLKTYDDTAWNGSLVFGVSTVSPREVNFIDWMPSCEQGKSCLYNGTKIVDCGNETETKTNIDKLTEGSTIGICRRVGNRLELYVNGESEATIRTSIDSKEDIYGCVDVYGKAVAVTVLCKDMRPKRGDPNLKVQIIESGKTPARRVFFNAIDETLKLMTNRSMEFIPRVCKALESNLLYPYEHIKDGKLKATAADQLAVMKCGEIFKAYLQFLKLCDMDSEMLSTQCFDAILYTCWAYSNESLRLCREYGDSGLLETCVKELAAIKDSWTKKPGKKDRARKLIGICHNCSKATENKAIFQRNNFTHIAKYFVNNRQEMQIGISALLTSSYVLRPDETDHLETPPKICKALLEILDAAAKRTPYASSGYSANELATGITGLCVFPANIAKFLDAGASTSLTRMLMAEERSLQECALNAIWSLTTKETHEQVRKTDKLMSLLREAEVSGYDEVKQAATRLMIKLTKLAEHTIRKSTSSVKISDSCPYAKICKQFKASLKLADGYFDSEFDMCYCEMCHGNRGDRGYYTRGDPPKEYGLPIGWFRFALKTHPRAKPTKAFDLWHRAYHGTKKDSLSTILQVGELVPAGRRVLGGIEVKELPNHFSDARKPEGFDTKQIFLSPSIRYSGHDTYAVPSNYNCKQSGKKYIAKVAFQVLIHPTSYKVGPQTIAAFSELDPGFSNQELEWMTSEQGSTMIYGLVIKLSES